MDSKYLAKSNEWLIVVDRDLDLYNVPALRKLFMDCIEEKEANFVLDCSQMNFIDSTGLGELASLMKTIRGYKGTITIHGLKNHINKIFTLTGLNTIFNIEGDEDE